MNNADCWEPTKYVVRNGRLRGSRDPRHLAVSSQLAADLFAERYQKYLPLHVHGRLLDLGCGTAPLFAAYRDFATEVTTLDWAESRHASPNVDVLHDLRQPLPFAEARFDCVVLSDVLEHIARPHRLCDEIARVLAKGGRLIGTVPFYYPIHEEPHDYFRYTGFGLRHLFETAGLRVVVLEPTGGSVEILADILAKHLAAGSRIGRVLAGLLQKWAFSFGKSRLGRALGEKSAARFPFGYFFVAAKPD